MRNVPSPHDVISSHQQAIGSAAASLQQALESARQPLQNAYLALRRRSNEVLQDTHDYIERSPFTATSSAFGAGLVLGVVLGVVLCSLWHDDEDAAYGGGEPEPRGSHLG